MVTKNKGFTLIELIVALAIGSIIIATATRFLGSALKQYSRDNYEIKLQTEVEEILNLLENWIMDAESVQVDRSKANDILMITKKLPDGQQISSNVYVRDDGIYYDKQYSDKSVKEVYLGNHIKVYTAADNKRSLTFNVSGNKKTVQVKLDMEFGSASYSATRKILLRNWKEEEKIIAEVDPPKVGNISVSISDPVKNIQTPHNTNHSQLIIPFNIKNTVKDLSLPNLGGMNGLEIVVKLAFIAKNDTAEAMKNLDLWSCDNGIVNSVSIGKYPGSKEKNNFEMYYGVVNIKSTLDLEKKGSNLGWLLYQEITHTLKCDLISLGNHIDIKLNEFNSHLDNLNGFSQLSVSVYYAGKTIGEFGSTNTFPENVEDVPETVEIEYNANGGSNAPGKQIVTKGESFTISGQQPTKSGYSFIGWSRNQNASSPEYLAGATYSIEENLVLYAVWKDSSTQYTISYDANGGNYAPQTQSKRAGEQINISWNGSWRDGYTFLGWSTDKDAKTPEYLSGAVYSDDNSIKLYAVWSKNSTNYYIGFNANGGNNAPNQQIKKEGETLKLSSQEPTRDGYTFLGWSKAYNATEAEFLAGGDFTEDIHVTLYAVWKDERGAILSVGSVWGDKDMYVAVKNAGGSAQWNEISVRRYYLYSGSKKTLAPNKSFDSEIYEDNFIAEFEINGTTYYFGYISYSRSSGTLNNTGYNTENIRFDLNSYYDINMANLYDGNIIKYIDISGMKGGCIFYKGELVSGSIPAFKGTLIHVSNLELERSNNVDHVSFRVNKLGNSIDWSKLLLTFYMNEDDRSFTISNVTISESDGGPENVEIKNQVHKADGSLNKDKANASVTFGFSGGSSDEIEAESFIVSFDVSGDDNNMLTETASFSCIGSGENIYGQYSGDAELLNGNSDNKKTFGKYPTRDVISEAIVVDNPSAEIKYPEIREPIKQILIEYYRKNTWDDVAIEYHDDNNYSQYKWLNELRGEPGKSQTGDCSFTIDLEKLEPEKNITYFVLHINNATLKSIVVICK